MNKEYERIHDGWMELILRYPWYYFFTLTFRDTVHPEQAEKAFKYFLCEINKRLYGASWRHHRLQMKYFIAIERQRRQVIHFHVILYTPKRPLMTWIQLAGFAMLWWKIAGFNKLEFIRDVENVADYCSKYVYKGGELYTNLTKKDSRLSTTGNNGRQNVGNNVLTGDAGATTSDRGCPVM